MAKSTEKPEAHSEVKLPEGFPDTNDIRQLSLAMSELATSLHELVAYFEKHPEIKDLPTSLKDLTKRISVLSTRL